MRRSVVSFIRARPRLYDAINGLRKTHGELGDWLTEFRNAHSKVTFVQIGASDGLIWDPFRKHILKGGWSGVLVEPLPPVFELLKKNYEAYTGNGTCNLTFSNVAVSDSTTSSLTFWVCSSKFLSGLPFERQLYWLRMSSLSREFLEDKVAKLTPWIDPQDAVQGFDVPVLSTSQLLDEYWGGDPVDLLISDAEGVDDRVIYGLDMSRHIPKAIVYESNGLGVARSERLREYLVGHGFIVKRIDSDTVAMRA